MSTETDGVPTWPTEALEPPVIGEELAQSGDPFATAVWMALSDAPGTMPVTTLLGTSVPGGFQFKLPPLTDWWSDVEMRDDKIDKQEWIAMAQNAIDHERNGDA